MCMITYLPPNVKVPEDGILNGATWNDDGHGWAVAAKTGLMITGRYMDSIIALETFVAVREAFPEAPALFHSRWATHGLVNTKNVHPFSVGSKDTVVAHNGILPTEFHPKGKDTRSDTAVMAQEWLGRQTRGTWSRKERRRIGAIIGSSNKLVILSTDARFPKPRGFVINQTSGEWAKGGAWFSNGDHLSSWRRGRYSTCENGASWLWNGDSDYSASAKALPSSSRAGTYHAFGGDDECPQCFAKGGIDPASNICTFCDFCLDCLEELRNCLCYIPETPATGYSTPLALTGGRQIETSPDLGLFQEPGEDNLGKALAIIDGDAGLDR